MDVEYRSHQTRWFSSDASNLSNQLIIFKQRQRTLTIFQVRNFAHTSTVLEHECNANFHHWVLCVRKSKVDPEMEQRADVVETMTVEQFSRNGY